MSEKNLDDTADESTRSDDVSDEQADNEGFISSITGYFSGDDSDDQSEDGTDSGGSTEREDQSGGRAEPIPEGGPTGEGLDLDDPATDITQGETGDALAGPGDDEQAFTDLVDGENETQTVGSADDSTTADEAGEALQEGVDEVPEPNESPADIEPDEDAPPVDLDEDSEDPFEEMEGVFEEMDAESADSEEVWTDVSEAEQQAATGESERTHAEVSKHDYCETCEHFTPPPEASCSHDGTDIVEFTDMEHVRVADCPIVAKRRKLEEGMQSAFSSAEDSPEALEMDDAGELEE